MPQGRGGEGCKEGIPKGQEGIFFSVMGMFITPIVVMVSLMVCLSLYTRAVYVMLSPPQ